MTTLAMRNTAVDAFNLPRVGAWTGSLSLHLILVCLLFGTPVALHWVQKAPPQPIISVFLKDKPKVVTPIPAMPEPTKINRHRELTHLVSVTLPSISSLITPVTPVSVPVVATLPVATAASRMANDSPPTALAYGNSTQVAYPISALRRREQGTVILRVLVSAQGVVSIVKIERSSGFDDLDNAARAAVQKWHFQPASHAGLAQQAWARVPITFRLSRL